MRDDRAYSSLPMSQVYGAKVTDARRLQVTAALVFAGRSVSFERCRQPPEGSCSRQPERDRPGASSSGTPCPVRYCCTAAQVSSDESAQPCRNSEPSLPLLPIELKKRRSVMDILTQEFSEGVTKR